MIAHRNVEASPSAGVGSEIIKKKFGTLFHVSPAADEQGTTDWEKQCAAKAAEVSDAHRMDATLSIARGKKRSDAAAAAATDEVPATELPSESGAAIEEPTRTSSSSSSSSDALLAGWVVVEEGDLPPDDRIIPFMKDDGRNQALRSVAQSAAIAGTAGLLFFGPVAATAIAAGTVAKCAEPGSLSAAAKDAAIWAKYKVPKSMDECRPACEALAGKAREAYAAVSGSALAEKDREIQRLRAELDASSRMHGDEEQCRAKQLHEVEKGWRDQRTRLSSQLKDVEQACAEGHQRLEAVQLAKDEEVSRLKQELKATENVWEEDTNRLNRALEDYRSAHLSDHKRLSAELDDVTKAREAELAQLQTALAEAERVQAALEESELAKVTEMQAKELTLNELEAAKRKQEEDNEQRRCCICMENEKQILFMPCRHVCCCSSCAHAVGKCPVCRGTVEQRIDFIMS